MHFPYSHHSFEETIDEVVNSVIIHPFPDVKHLRYSTYRSRSKKLQRHHRRLLQICQSHYLMIELLFLEPFFLTTSKLQIPSVVLMKIGLARALLWFVKTKTSKVNILETYVSKCLKRPKVSSRRFTAFSVILTGSLPKKKESLLH
jgi:hypothetical protein